ncbi:hypothetical protein WL99_34335 [Burkholderia cepacia]|nr:hypothetical protein WL99_34335 [Burkholderia cepacia]
MTWTTQSSQLFNYSRLQLIIEGFIISQLKKQWHEKATARHLTANHQTIFHLIDFVDNTINFRRSDANAVPIQSRIGTTIYITTLALRQAHKVAVSPYPREEFEIGFSITLISSIIPEVNGHRRCGLHDDQLADLVDY